MKPQSAFPLLLGLAPWMLLSPAPQHSPGGSWGPLDGEHPAYLFKEEALTLESTAGEDEVVIVVVTESEEEVDWVEVCSNQGTPLLQLRGNAQRGLTFQGLVLESAETGLFELAQRYPEGEYQLRGRTSAGELVMGSAVLSHQLPAPTPVLHPAADSSDVATEGLLLQWEANPSLEEFRVSLEQEGRDVLCLLLPGDRDRLLVPDGILAPETETMLEIGAVGSNGNVTNVEVTFCTGPR